MANELEEGQEEKTDDKAWMTTFSDLSILLLTFFVLLLSFANLDVKEFRMALGSVRDALGVKSSSQGTYMALSTSFLELSERQTFDYINVFEEMSMKPGAVNEREERQKVEALREAMKGYLRSMGIEGDQLDPALDELEGLLEHASPETNTREVVQAFLRSWGLDESAADGVGFVSDELLRQMEGDRALVDGIRKFLAQQGLENEVDVAITPRGVTLRMSANVLFASGSDRLRNTGVPALALVAGLAQRFPESLSIEGHTDSLPIRTRRFPSNWELSTARASSVLRYLESQGVDAGKMHIAGYGSERPITPNDTPDNRSRNRRVEFVFQR